MSALKSVALKCVAAGFNFPQGSFDRIGELQTLRGLIGLLKVDCVIDVGANRGQFSKELRGVGYAGQIISFEPIRSEFDALSAAFAGDKLWQGKNMALGSRSDKLEIVIPGLSVLGSLLQPKFKSQNTRTESIDIARLDQILPSLLPDWQSRRVYLKMDTQGYDLEVFNGAGGIIGCIVGLQSELSVQPLYEGMPHYIDALRRFEDSGFDLHDLSVVGRSPEGGVVELNGYMRRRV